MDPELTGDSYIDGLKLAEKYPWLFDRKNSIIDTNKFQSDFNIDETKRKKLDNSISLLQYEIRKILKQTNRISEINNKIEEINDTLYLLSDTLYSPGLTINEFNDLEKEVNKINKMWYETINSLKNIKFRK